MHETSEYLQKASYVLNDAPGLADFEDRHGIQSAAVLTVCDDRLADGITNHLHDRIAGKVVVEIGGGVGLLALHLAGVAKKVFCIEANPMWSTVFVRLLIDKKPPNLSFLFGMAEEFTDFIRADVALFCTHSGLRSMSAVAARMAPEVIDVYGEMMHDAPEKFNPKLVEIRSRS